MQVAAWRPAVYGNDPVVAALHSLFRAFEAEEAQRRLAGPLTGTMERRGVVDPTQLREALAALPGQLFRVGTWCGVRSESQLAACLRPAANKPASSPHA